MSRRKNYFDLSILIYLYLPVIIFGLTWLKLPFGIILLIGSSYLFVTILNNEDSSNINWKRMLIPILIITMVLLIWCLLSGLGGYFLQSYDWQKHNVLLNDFINKTWPVHYNFNGKNGVVSYYVAEYILPGLVGKVLGFNAAQVFLLFWIFLSLFLLVFSLYKWINRENGYILLLIIGGLILFSPFIYPLNGIYSTWQPMDAKQIGEMGEWFSNSLIIQYTSNISLLRFVFPQFVPVALSVSLWLRNRYNYKYWGAYLAPLALYSTFTFIGLGILMFLTIVYDWLINKRNFPWKDVIDLRNLFSAIIIVILLLYIFCNILQPKPMDNQMQFSFIDVWHHKTGFVIFQAAWMIWVLLLIKYERKNTLIYVVSILLFFLPFCKYGAANDLVMRVSVPALLVLNFLVIKDIVIYWKKDRYFSLVLIGALIISGIGPLWQLKNAAGIHNIQSHFYNMPYETGNQFFKSDKNVVYQYVDWSSNLLRKILLRN